MAGKPLHDMTEHDAETGPRWPWLARPLVLVGLLLAAGCAPLIVVPDLEPVAFLVLNLSYMLLACVAGTIVLGLLIAWRRGLAAAADGFAQGELRRWMLAAIITTGITLSHFQVFKQLVLPHRGFPLDAMIAQAERQILLGRDAWEWTHAAFGGLGPTLILDAAYALWLPIMFLFPAAVVVMVADVRTRGRLIGTWVASWIVIGSLGAWFLASAGPCYYNDLVGLEESFLRLHRALVTLNEQARPFGLTIHALNFQEMLRQSQGGQLVFASGISAMPSMHVAMATLFAIAGFQISRRLGWAFATYALLIWIASIHLGWHYAADGLLGGAMMTGLWLLSGPITRAVLSGVELRRRGRAASFS